MERLLQALAATPKKVFLPLALLVGVTSAAAAQQVLDIPWQLATSDKHMEPVNATVGSTVSIVLVLHTGDREPKIDAAYFAGPGAGDYSLNPPIAGTKLPKCSMVPVTILFHPNAPGPRPAALHSISDYQEPIHDSWVIVHGNGVGVPPPAGTICERLAAGTREMPHPGDLASLEGGERRGSVEDAGSLGIKLISVGGDKNREVYIRSYVRYSDLREGNETVRVGCGFRWVVDATRTKGHAGFAPAIAKLVGSVKHHKIIAWTHFDVIGVTNPKIAHLVNILDGLTDATVQQVEATFQALQDLFDDKDTVLTPKVIVCPAPSTDITLDGHK